MNRRDLSQVENALVHDAVGKFDDPELDGLPDPVQHLLRTAIEPGAPLSRTARLRMRGHIKVGRWLPFRAREVLSPLRGSIWTARAAGVIAGSDYYAQGQGEMDWKVAGVFRVMKAEGPDVSRSAAERAASEAAFLPTTLLPRFGVDWIATDDNQISARYAIDDKPVEVHYTLTPDRRIQSVVFDRWGDPDNTRTWGPHHFGGDFTSYTTFNGITIPDAGRLGWHYGTDRWNEGEFFRYRITAMTPLAGTTT